MQSSMIMDKTMDQLLGLLNISYLKCVTTRALFHRSTLQPNFKSELVALAPQRTLNCLTTLTTFVTLLLQETWSPKMFEKESLKIKVSSKDNRNAEASAPIFSTEMVSTLTLPHATHTQNTNRRESKLRIF